MRRSTRKRHWKIGRKNFLFSRRIGHKEIIAKDEKVIYFYYISFKCFSQITSLIAFSKRERRDIRDRFTKIHFDRLSPKNSSLFKIGNFKNTFALL
jgi:hypothetical protein